MVFLTQPISAAILGISLLLLIVPIVVRVARRDRSL
jgi:TctA family transporter